MTIKKQYRLLMISMVSMLVIVNLILVISKGYVEGQFKVESKEIFVEYIKALKENRLDDFTIGKKFLEKLGIDLAVIDFEGEIIFSTIPLLIKGGYFFEDVKSFIIKDDEGYTYSIGLTSRYTEGGLNDKSFFFIREKRNSDFFSFLGKFKHLLSVGIFTCLLFAFFVAVKTIRSIMVSIIQLDNLTRNISPSQLDKEITITGSEEIRSLAHSFNLIRFEIKEANVRRSQFIMGLSHDFKTPLSLIKGYAEVVQSKIKIEKDDSKKEYLEIISSKVDQLEGILDDLLDFVSIDGDERNFSLVRVDFTIWMKSFIERSQYDGNLLGNTVESKITISERVFVMMNDKLVERALDNIVHNALRYIGKNGIVTISVFSKLGNIHIVIDDNGPGIPEKDIPFIFDAFYRGSPSRLTQGTGLGLAVVKSILDLHGWIITVNSKVGCGTSFEIVIPHRSIIHAFTKHNPS